MMADSIVGLRGSLNLSTYLVGKTENLKFAALLLRLPPRQHFRSVHDFGEKGLSQGQDRAWVWAWASARKGRSGLIWAHWAMAQERKSAGSNHISVPSTADEEKDESMVFRRTVFDHEDWTRHRSSDRHSRHIWSIASSRVIRSLGPPVLRLTFIAALVAAFNDAVLMDLFPPWVPLLHVPSLPFQLTAPALALLLVFRTNASYARFLEARKAWGSNVNRSRDFARQALTWIRHTGDSDNLDRLLRYCVVFPYCLKDHLTEGGRISEEFRGLLDQDELEVFLGNPHKPNYVLQTMSEIVHSCKLSDMERALLDRNMTQFHDNLGTCERIFKTPIPLSYTRLTSRFLVIWHAALPFALWDQCSWVVIPATFLSAGALFCIEEVGVVIEEPLSMLSLDSICTTIQKSVDGLRQAHADNLILSKKLRWKESLRVSQVNGILKQGGDGS